MEYYVHISISTQQDCLNLSVTLIFTSWTRTKDQTLLDSEKSYRIFKRISPTPSSSKKTVLRCLLHSHCFSNRWSLRYRWGFFHGNFLFYCNIKIITDGSLIYVKLSNLEIHCHHHAGDCWKKWLLKKFNSP